MKIINVVMAGGSGSRLWPLSRKSLPKQFLEIASNQTMLAETLTRFENLEFNSQILICNEDHRFLVANALHALNMSDSDVILEPMGKNTAPAAVLAALHCVEKYEDAIIVLTPSDHKFTDIKDLENQIVASMSLANDGNIVTFGIDPGCAETGYGYIQYGSPIKEKIHKIVCFHEKPSENKANELLNRGDCLWNSGIFMFKASSFLEEAKVLIPEIEKICKLSLEHGSEDSNFIYLNNEHFASCPANSIDYAIMEHTDKGVVASISCEWSDLGSWKAVWDFNDKNNDGNVIQGDVITYNTENSLIFSDKKHLIAAIGINNLAIIETNDALLVMDMNHSQNVKDIVVKLKSDSRKEFVTHREVHRPWGKFDSIDSSHRYQVKRITVEPGEKLSVQMHYHRAEHWVVVGGTALVHKGRKIDNLKTHILRENESIYIELGEIHSLENPGSVPLEIIEVQSGSYLGEDDIVRFEDKYNRD